MATNNCEIYSAIRRPLDAFVKYFLDVKPYHTKLLEVLEIYNFYDTINVKIDENVVKDITFLNKPLCNPTGWGVDWDDQCGFDAISCCDLFDCIGGYGLIYNNSDLLVTANVISSTTDGTVTLNGNYTYDTKIPIKAIQNAEQFTVAGDQTTYFNTFNVFLVIPRHIYTITAVNAHGFTVTGDIASEAESRRTFIVYGSFGNDGTYIVNTASYDASTNLTTILVIEHINHVGGTGFIQINASNKNNGVYQVLGTPVFNGVDTIVTINGDTKKFTVLGESTHGSVQFRSGLIYPRHITLTGSSANNDGDYKIMQSLYDYTTNKTTLTFSGMLPDASSTGTVNLYGYEFEAGFEAGPECSIPKPADIHMIFSERLVINSIRVPTPTPTLSSTATPTPSPTVTPTATNGGTTPTPTPSVTPTAFAVFGREVAGAALLPSTKVIIIGGDDGVNLLNSSTFYNPGTGLFETGPSMLTTREAFSTTVLNDGKILITGGFDGVNAASDLAEIYDPVSNTFSPTNGNMSAPRSNHTADLMTNGKVLITGGLGLSSLALNTAEIYDPNTGLFSATANTMNSARSQHTTTALTNGKVLITGGTDSINVLDTAEIYDPNTDAFTFTSNNMSNVREYQTATLLNDGKVLVTGGSNPIVDTADLYDPVSNTFSATGNMTDSRWTHNATLLQDGKVLISGGQDASNVFLNTAETYDPTSHTFTAANNTMSDARELHTSTTLADGKVLVAGGFTGITITDSADIYDPVTRLFTPTTGPM